MEDIVETSLNNIFKCLINQPKPKRSAILKRHSENLHLNGDCSFPSSIKPWIMFLNAQDVLVCKNVKFLEYMKIDLDELVLESKHWPIPLLKAVDTSDRIYVHFERSKATEIGLINTEKNRNIILNRNINMKCVYCDPECETLNDLTSLRLKLLKMSIQNLISLKALNSEELPKIFLTSKSFNKTSDEHQSICCGPVLNIKSGAKETINNADTYIKIRQNEMSLIAQHKYGVRVSTDPKWSNFLAHLGESAVTFELLQIKISSPVKVNFDCPAGSSKGASFVLYNCARLETILRTFNDKVSEGLYPSLPTLQDVDFKLLSHEDEWTLMYNYVLNFPFLVQSCMETHKGSYEFRPHAICGYLCSMVKVFSQYYRKVRVLIEPRAHLLPVMFARLYLLRALNDTLKSCLDILNIKSVSQM